MRVFITVLVLIFSLQSWTKADDISDLEIEGMSIGDSLLDYFSEKQIKNSISDVYDDLDDKTFVMAGFSSSEHVFETYDVIQITFKTEDKNYKIYGIAGKLMFYENIDACRKKQTEILKEISPFMKNSHKVSETLKHSADPTGRSKIYSITWWFKSADLVALDCYDWHEDMPYADNLKVAADTKEFNDWLVKWQ